MTSIVLTSTAVLVLAGGILVASDALSVRRSLVRTLTTRAQILAANSTAALAFQNPDDATQVLGALSADPDMMAGALYDTNGSLFATFPRDAAAPLVPTSAPGHGFSFDKNSLVLYQPVLQDGRPLGTLYLKSSLRELSDRWRLSVLMVALAIAGSIGVAFALAAWLQRGITTPVQALAELARKLSEQQDYHLRAAVTSDDELGLLADSFNEMLTQVELRDGKIRQLNTRLERRVAVRTAELEASNRELEAFSYSVSHDLRAPLRHIDGFADLLQRQTAVTLDDKCRRYLGSISESAKSMGMLIDDLLSFSRMGRSELRATSIGLATMVADVRREVERDAAGRKIVWQIGSLPEIQADPAMLRQVVANLLSNAVKYTRGREEARIEIGAVESEAETTIFVRDNGAGFDPAYSHKLFGVFQRLHSADEFEGTGIGLANVHRIIQRHGGKTWAEGQVGAGATFFFSLPRGESVHELKEVA
jgi:signal transduction histidine kinase